jgi:hypothetical protein
MAAIGKTQPKTPPFGSEWGMNNNAMRIQVVPNCQRLPNMQNRPIAEIDLGQCVQQRSCNCHADNYVSFGQIGELTRFDLAPLVCQISQEFFDSGPSRRKPNPTESHSQIEAGRGSLTSSSARDQN